MAHSIKIKFGLGQQAAIQLSHQNSFIFKIGTCQKLTKRTYDATSTAGKNCLRFFSECRGVVLREVTATVELVAAQHKAAAFGSNVLHGGRPGGAMVSGWRAINLNTLGIHERPQQGHVI